MARCREVREQICCEGLAQYVGRLVDQAAAAGTRRHRIDDGLEWPVVAAQRGGEPHGVRVVRDRRQAGRQLGAAAMRCQ